MERSTTNEMAEVVLGSNQFKRLGVGLAETLRLCLMIFKGRDGFGGVEWVNKFVKEDGNMTEELIKDTHAIGVGGLSAAEAGSINSVFLGERVNRQQHTWVGAVKMTKPSEPVATTKSMVANLGEDLAHAEKSGTADPFILAAKYCDRFVNIHPFKDGNVVVLYSTLYLFKYAGIAISLGEKSHDRDEYL
ncbi:MAG: hypothetical protein Q9174_001881 [Haloplaca sp. 1 TL-2023]